MEQTGPLQIFEADLKLQTASRHHQLRTGTAMAQGATQAAIPFSRFDQPLQFIPAHRQDRCTRPDWQDKEIRATAEQSEGLLLT